MCFVLSSDPLSQVTWNGRIVGGATASIGQFPYQVSLRRARNATKHVCGGSILNEKWVITVSHCLLYFDAVNEALIVVGIIDLESDGTSYNVERFFFHPEFNKVLKQNDVGLMQTSANIEFNQNVQPIPISYKFVQSKSKATTCGWGRISIQGARTNFLQYLNIYIMDNEECRQAHRISKRSPFIYDNVLCTCNTKMRGTCNGDSGGALVVNEELVGLVSWGIRCAIGLPDVFTRLSEHVGWIEKIIS